MITLKMLSERWRQFFFLLLFTCTSSNSQFFGDIFQADNKKGLPSVDCDLIVNYNQSVKTLKPCFEYQLDDFTAIDGKLFLYDDNIIGLLTSHNFEINFFRFSPYSGTITHLEVKTDFNGLVPSSACVGTNKLIYISFSDAHKIKAYQLEYDRHRSFYYLKAKLTKNFNALPYGLSCSEKAVYVTFKGHSLEPLALDFQLNEVSTIDVKNELEITPEKLISIDNEVNIIQDGYSSVALYNTPQFNLEEWSICHFYVADEKLDNGNCIDDVNIQRSQEKLVVHVTDTCQKTVTEFVYIENNRFSLRNIYKTEGDPKSAVANKNGFLFVVTINPRKLYVYNKRSCKPRPAFYKMRRGLRY